MFRGWTPLAKELANALLSRDAHTLKGVYGGIAGLYEWLWDQAAPGASSQSVRGEDHSGGGNDGGIPIPRNCFISAGYGSSDQYMWRLDNLDSVDGWVPVDNDYSNGRSANLNYHFAGYVDEGLDTPTHPTLYGEAVVYMAADDGVGDTNLSVRIYNRTLNQYSATTTLTTANTHIEGILIEDIHLSEDRKNEFQLEVSTGGEGVTVWTYGADFFEVYKAGAKSRSAHSSPKTQPPSSGTEVA